ncbi:MAG: asparagine synthetase B family protein, partial [Parachlamydiaceae bacterium]
MTRDLARIAGVIYPDPIQVDECIESMLDTMEKGLKPIRERKTIKNFQFGITGTPFFYNEKKGLLIGLDGFIENERELKADVKNHGLIPGESQSELVLQAYELFDADFLQKIEGSFGLFIFDEARKELLLARDRIGKKPLYWYHDQKHFIFGSELKSLIATGIIPQTFSPDAIAMYLYFGYIPQDLSPIKDVNKLLPANYLLYSPKKGISIRPYWSYSHFFERKEDNSAKHVKETIERYLSEAIERQLPSTEGVCSFLSGGIGSATVAYELSRIAKKSDAYTVYFQGKTESDLEATKIVASTLKLPHHIAAISPANFTANLVETIWA